ncbi:MAG: hypothetical protein ABH812_01505 [bacterium]
MMIKIKRIGFQNKSFLLHLLNSKKIVLFIFLLLFVILSKKVYAKENNQFVTIVNPVRLSSYNKNPGQSILSEYSVVNKLNLPATWLLTYDVLGSPSLVSLFKRMNKDQEFGIFLEVTENFSNNAGVIYNNTGFWHHANSVFLSGYKQEERIKLIDTVFEKFKNEFSFYPTSVGSWWTDSYSLSYMKEKYGINANLGCSDQFSTDGYKIWGQPFSIPFYPSKYHSGIPASDEAVKLGIVTTLWAPRDPLNGYYSSLFSTQDYLMAGKGLDTEYFKKLVSIYANKNDNSFGQITIGLEGDLDKEVYGREYLNQILYIKSLLLKNEIEVLNMSKFSEWYRKTYPKLIESYFIKSTDLLGTNNIVTWFQNSKYRLSYEEDSNGQITIRDFRVYDKNFQEPYYISPNRNFSLKINIPSVIDKVSYPDNVWVLEKGSSISFLDDKIIVKTNTKIPEFIKKSKYLNIEKRKNEIQIAFKDFEYPKEGKIIKDFSVEAKHTFRSPKAMFRAVFSAILNSEWGLFKKIDYLIPQEEIHALEFLNIQPKGKVLVYDKECLQCSYSTEFRPPVFSNIRDYVGKFSNKKIVYNSSIFELLSREEAKKKLKSLGVKYIYLVKFEDYEEKIPYSPGDLGIEKIFENANSEIWRVK